MLKAEFRKMFKQGLIYFVLIGVLVAVLFSTIYFSSESTLDSYKHYGYQISPYESIDDVEALLKDAYKSLENPNDLDGETIGRIKTSINIYEYLINEKYIEYDELVDYQGLSIEFYANKFAFFKYFIGIMRIALPIVLGIMASLIVTTDFQVGMQKSLYTRSCSRLKVVGIKYSAWAITSAVLILITTLFGSLYGLYYDNFTEINSIILANSSGAIAVNYFEIILIELADILVRVFAYGSIAFGLSLYCKNILIALVPNVVMYGLVYAFSFVDNALLTNITLGIISVFEYDCSANINILYSLLIYSVAIGLSMLCLIYFRKRDIK